MGRTPRRNTFVRFSTKHPFSLTFSLAMSVALATAAEAQSGNSAAAEAVFEKAITELKAGNLDAACPAFAESQRLDPRAGTLFSLAECEAKRGRAATASALFADYLSSVDSLPAGQRAKHRERASIAEDRRKQLAPDIAHITITLAPGAPRGAEVRLDETPLGAPSLGLELPVDPGAHTISASAAGRRDVAERLVLGKGERRSVKLVLKTDAPPAASSPDSIGKPPPPEAEPAAADPVRPDRTALYAAAGVGAAGVAVGLITGALVFRQKSTVDAHCVGVRCDSQGKQAADDARPLATASNIAFGVGLAGLAVGAILWLTTNDEAPAATGRWKGGVSPSRQGATLTLHRSW
jgi:hypothetical protein